MEGLKKFANKKIFTLLIFLQAALALVNTFNTYISMRDYLVKADSYILVPGLMCAAGLGIIAYSLHNNRIDVILLIGAAMNAAAYLIKCIAVMEWFSIAYILVWLAICLLILIIIASDKIAQLDKIKKHSITIAKSVAIMFVVLQILFVFSMNYYKYGEFNFMAIVGSVFSGTISAAITGCSYSAFTIYLGLLAYGEELLDSVPEANSVKEYSEVESNTIPNEDDTE